MVGPGILPPLWAGGCPFLPLTVGMQPGIASATLKALWRILRATDRVSRKLAAATGLTPSQLLGLREVEARDAVTPGSIAQRLQFSHATIKIGRASCRERVCQYV